ncbi:hypothetical protein FVE85_9505 [Porphyridium purpureum]|uniref:Uncharacterized protein n=1 Tax=Porphyridium purpureum TaxID=35688 RepID=A0A5J4YK18_PORPP|nr:hypothetical protein FVE85_9505 [Porphyridium purpureum]|eukprot:POR7408..scf261_15
MLIKAHHAAMLKLNIILKSNVEHPYSLCITVSLLHVGRGRNARAMSRRKHGPYWIFALWSSDDVPLAESNLSVSFAQSKLAGTERRHVVGPGRRWWRHLWKPCSSAGPGSTRCVVTQHPFSQELIARAGIHSQVSGPKSGT